MLVLNAYSGKVRRLSFSATDNRLASTGGGAKRITLWDLATLQGDKIGNRNRNGPTDIAFAPAGCGLFANYEHEVCHWPQPLEADDCRVTSGGNQAAWSPDGTRLAVVVNTYSRQLTWQLSHELRLLRSQDGERLPVPAVILPGQVRHLRWSPVEELLVGVRATAGTSTILAIRPGQADPVSEMLALHDHLNDVQIHPSGRSLALACGNGILRCDLETGEMLPALRGHTRLVNQLGYLPDGRLLSCSNDGTVRTWDHDSEKCREVRDWELEELSALSLAGDGMRAAVGSKNGTILVWDID